MLTQPLATNAARAFTHKFSGDHVDLSPSASGNNLGDSIWESGMHPCYSGELNV